MSARSLLDPRYHWLSSAIRRIYDRLDPGEMIIGLTLVTASSDETEMLTTVVDADGKMQRRLITDESQMLRAAEQVTRESTVALDVPDEMQP